MSIKIENLSSVKIRINLNNLIGDILRTVPSSHVRGIEKVLIVDQISDKTLSAEILKTLPGLYHPRQTARNQQAWLEIAIRSILPKKPFIKSLMARLSLKSNLIGVTLSLIGQHYYLTLVHGIKKHQYEFAIRNYVEKYFIEWRNINGGWRSRIFKPLQPYLDRIGKWLAKNYQKQKNKKLL